MIPILARVRQSYEQITLPLGRVCIRMGLTANTLTYLSLALSIVTGYLIARNLFWWGIIGILLASVADVLDGATARASSTASPYGTVLDHVSDRYAEFFFLGGVMLSGVSSPIWVLFALFGMVMASYVRARAEATGQLPSCNVGFAGRQEKLIILILGLFLQPLMPQLFILEWALILIGIVSHITALQRLRYTRQMLSNPKSSADLRQGSGLIR
ncbi:MAG: CDP-alcohol phosphatidyltransferase family protein [Oscillochloris sp.]|nr:CDP-alcohol phosphatidyltransferase family protein [Oscillochloris sp.]